MGYHLTQSGLAPRGDVPMRLWNLMSLGGALTGLFLMLSGFMMYYAYATPTGELRVAPRELWRRRLVRLFPLMALGHVLAAPFALSGEVAYSLPEAVARGVLVLTATQVWIPTWSTSYNGPSWSIAVIVACYIAFPVLARVIGRRRPMELGLLLLVCWAAMLLPTTLHYLSLPTGLSPASDAPDSFAEMFLHAFPLVRLPDFIAGAALARLYVLLPSSWRPVLSAMGLLAASGVVAFLSDERHLPVRFIANGLLSPLYWIVLLGAASAPHAFNRVAVRCGARRLGEAAFAVFILHMPILSALRAAVARGWTGDTDWWVVLSGYVLLVLAVSMQAERWIVRPAGDWLGRRLGIVSGPVAAIRSVTPTRSVPAVSASLRASREIPAAPRSTAA